MLDATAFPISQAEERGDVIGFQLTGLPIDHDCLGGIVFDLGADIMAIAKICFGGKDALLIRAAQKLIAELGVVFDVVAEKMGDPFPITGEGMA